MLVKLIVFLFLLNSLQSATLFRNDTHMVKGLFPCKYNADFSIVYIMKSQRDPEFYFFEVNQFPVAPFTVLIVTFSDFINVDLKPTNNIILNYRDPYSVVLYYTRIHSENTVFAVFGRNPKVLPAITSITVNGIEKCTEPLMNIMDMVINTNMFRPLQLDSPIPTCGRRQLVHAELITHSTMTKPGDWPWHAAIYRKDRGTFDYRCGGTLLSNTAVLTAGHCLIERGVNKVYTNEKVKVYLGKYNLYKIDQDMQEKEVDEIIVHENYNPANADNDIALIKLKNNVEFNNLVQPVCLWNDNVLNSLQNSDIHGTIVGWGFDENDRLSSEIRQASIPMVDRLSCVLSNTLFFGQYLNEFKFCAGYKNGTSACNGDSGSGFVVFVPDDTSFNTRRSILEGSWYIRGIVSVAVARRDANICERDSYVLFTDVSKFKEWIETHMDSNAKSEPIINTEVDSNNTMRINLKESGNFNKTLHDAIDNFNESSIIIDDSYTTNVTRSQADTADFESSTETTESVSVQSCGRKQIPRNESSNSEPGDWPWYAAVYGRTPNWTYLCGGTLLTKNVVITAAGCIRDNIIPDDIDRVRVDLGKYRYDNLENTVQIRRVSDIIYPETRRFTIDIALMKLNLDINYGPYIQPACLWNDEAENKVMRTQAYMINIYGSIVGWGDSTVNSNRNTLRTAVASVNSESCSGFYSSQNKGFCTQHVAGASCLIANGAGFMIFVPEDPENLNSSGSWFIRGVAARTNLVVNNTYCPSLNNMYFIDLKYSWKWVRNQILQWLL